MTYTPPTQGTETMRSAWAFAFPERADEFDRWLAAHDAEVAVRVLREAVEQHATTLYAYNSRSLTYVAVPVVSLRAMAEHIRGGAS
jgi:hypothetical protein